MAYPSYQQLIDQAAAAGFKIGDYAHSYKRDHRAAWALESFSMSDGVLVGVLMTGCMRAPLSELRLSTGHKRGAEFKEGYDFLTDPALIADVLRKAQAADFHQVAAYTGAWVKGYGTEQMEVWYSQELVPTDPTAVFCRLTNAPWPEG
jgi:hypothetical protein